jgi:hypothetical protein
LDDKQKEVYDQFTEMLADFDLYMMVIDQCLSHFSAMLRPCWLHRAEDDATILHERAVKF